jgi:hypothetical protein
MITVREFNRVLAGDHSKLDPCSKFVSAPAFCSAEAQSLGETGIDLAIILVWMNTAAQIATGGRKQVREDGARKMRF